MDERWESEVIEYGAINITGFRMIDTHKRYVKEFLEGWKKLDPSQSQGAGKELISVSHFSYNNLTQAIKITVAIS
jgi:ionotropic glutamate receptor